MEGAKAFLVGVQVTLLGLQVACFAVGAFQRRTAPLLAAAVLSVPVVTLGIVVNVLPD